MVRPEDNEQKPEKERSKQERIFSIPEPVFEMIPIPIGRGPYSASRRLYHTIEIGEKNRPHPECSDIGDLNLNYISGIFLLNHRIKREDLKDMRLKNWGFGRGLINGLYRSSTGEIFDAHSYFVAVSEEDSDSIMKITERLCEKFGKTTVLVKDYNAKKMFLVRIKNEVSDKTTQKTVLKNLWRI